MCRGMATSAIWKAMVRPWLMTLAPILMPGARRPCATNWRSIRRGLSDEERMRLAGALPVAHPPRRSASRTAPLRGAKRIRDPRARGRARHKQLLAADRRQLPHPRQQGAHSRSAARGRDRMLKPSLASRSLPWRRQPRPRCSAKAGFPALLRWPNQSTA